MRFLFGIKQFFTAILTVFALLCPAPSSSLASLSPQHEALTRLSGRNIATSYAPNAAAPFATGTRVIVVKPNFGPNGEDGVLDETREFVIGPATEIRTHDDDGNLTSDGLWNYSWDAENRLISIESNSTLPAAKRKRLEFVYDYAGRRAEKIVKTWNESLQTYVETDRILFIYQGWNLIAELDAAGNLRRTHTCSC